MATETAKVVFLARIIYHTHQNSETITILGSTTRHAGTSSLCGELSLLLRYPPSGLTNVTIQVAITTLLINLVYVYNHQETSFSAGRVLTEAGCNLAWQIAKTSPTTRVDATCGIHNTKVGWPGCLQSRYLQSRKLHSWYLRPSLLCTYANFELPFLLTPARVDIRVLHRGYTYVQLLVRSVFRDLGLLRMFVAFVRNIMGYFFNFMYHSGVGLAKCT